MHNLISLKDCSAENIQHVIELASKIKLNPSN